MEVGIDLVEIKRFKNIDNHFIDRIYTKEEKEYIKSKKENEAIYFYAGRWAVKEAIYKAINCNDYLSYSCVNDENGKPYIINHPEIKVSISHEKEYVIAIVII